MKLKNIASFKEEVQKLENLSRINFIYGCNGTGKTTISRVIKNPINFEDCLVKWQNNKEVETNVYNKDFIKDNFLSSKDLKGIFTLGKENKEVQEEINRLYDELKKQEEKVDSSQEQIEVKKAKIKELEDEFKETCWEYKKDYVKDFKKALSPYRGSKESFMEKLLFEFESNDIISKDKNELIERYKIIYEKSHNKIRNIDLLDFDKINKIFNNPIFSQVIVGKNDVDISKLITELKNDDWVRKGKKYLEKTENICPFCQNEIDNNLKHKLEQYFDSSYENKINNLKKLRNDLSDEIRDLTNKLDNLIVLDNEYLNKEEIEDISKIIKLSLDNNLRRISKKIEEPSKKIKFESILENIEKINKGIQLANSKIDKHNRIMDDLTRRKEILKEEIWGYIVNELNRIITNFKRKKQGLDKAVKGLKTQYDEELEESQRLENKLIDLEKENKTINLAKEEINSTLKNFGFHNFYLESSEEKEGYYKIVRENGESAKNSLSEGEISFITFLYFYQWIKGTVKKNDNIKKEKIIVIDDPVSSLDSNVLFVISSMIKDLIKEVHKQNEITQIFILTHNIYFHNEVVYDSNTNNYEDWDASFYIINKGQNYSNIKHYENNPVKTSYKMLWEEIKRVKDGERVISFQNIMRRIIEYYFKFLGNKSYNDIGNKFEGDKRRIYNSLISWINSGSHGINDDLFSEMTLNQQIKYFEVFKDIFYKTEHEKHYKMMMGEV